jgi:hypothetical protein
MLCTRLRRCAAVATLTLGGVVLFAGNAHAAADTTIVVESEDGVVFVEDPVVVSGTCTDGSTSAVVSVEQAGDVVLDEPVDLAEDGGWATELDLADADEDEATISVDCFAYGTEGPVGSASETVFVLSDSGVEVFEVSVSPSKVRIGSSFTASGTCPAGTTSAAVAAARVDADAPFVTALTTPAADGSVRWTAKVPATGVKPGDAVAVIACGVDDLGVFEDPGAAIVPTAFGFGEFSILAGPAAAPAPARPSATQPALANTGSDNGPLAGFGAGLLVLGALAYGARRFAG